METVVFAARLQTSPTWWSMAGRVVADRRHLRIDVGAELRAAISDLMEVRPEALRANS